MAHRLHRLERTLRGPDTSVSALMLGHAVDAIIDKVRVDRHHDVPYLAGYSVDGKTIYIDRHLPATFSSRGRHVRADRFLVLHEALEKTLMDGLAMKYQHAHQIATRAEQAAVRAAGASWRDYDRFMQKYIMVARAEGAPHLPKDLDLRPYHDEKDTAVLTRIDAARRHGGGKATGKRA